MKHIFGPIPSRRLGQSLGIDPVPFKTCNWNCVYCQLGRSVPLINTRKEYFPKSEIISEVRAALTARQPEEIDWITFVGSGETTLHNGIGWLIRKVKSFAQYPVAVITNGSFLYLPEVREELQAADAVLPTLDAGNTKIYRKINRPWPELTFERMVDGLISFKKSYRGVLWVEVMLVQGLNDSQEALIDIAEILDRIQPDQIQINVPARPPAESWVHPPNQEVLVLARNILGEIAYLIPPAMGVFDLAGEDSLVESILGIITRHPMNEPELHETLARKCPGQGSMILDKLMSSGESQIIERYGERFWVSADAKFSKHSAYRKTI